MNLYKFCTLEVSNLRLILKEVYCTFSYFLPGVIEPREIGNIYKLKTEEVCIVTTPDRAVNWLMEIIN